MSLCLLCTTFLRRNIIYYVSFFAHYNHLVKPSITKSTQWHQHVGHMLLFILFLWLFTRGKSHGQTKSVRNHFEPALTYKPLFINLACCTIFAWRHTCLHLLTCFILQCSLVSLPLFTTPFKSAVSTMW